MKESGNRHNRFRAETAIFIAHEEYIKSDPAESEKNLMRAILQSAMDDVRKNGDPHKQAFKYFTSNDDEYIYSFLSICSHLSLCSKTILNLLGIRNSKRSVEQLTEYKSHQTNIIITENTDNH